MLCSRSVSGAKVHEAAAAAAVEVSFLGAVVMVREEDVFGVCIYGGVGGVG